MPPRRRLGIKRGLLLVWLLALVASHGVRRLDRGRAAAEGADRPHVTVAGGAVTVAYREWGADRPGTPVILLHGSPGSSGDFFSMGPRLGRERRALAPDLPGFGASSHDVPDYSIRAHAAYVLQLADALGFERFHLVGFSMGGGVGLECYRQAPDRVASLTMLSAIGVQEMELFGNNRLNHAVHALQLGALWSLHELTPHFGWLDGSMLSIAYARNFYDTDQRPLRRVLRRFEPPMLILHGRDDFLVPVEAAREHARLVPQAELVIERASHFMVFRRGEELGGRIAAFLDRVDAGQAPDRRHADPERIRAAAETFDPRTVPEYAGFALVLSCALLALATLVSEDLACIGGGLMVAQGRLDALPAILACVVGIFVGDLLLFLAGRVLGRPALKRRPLSWFVSEEQVEISSRWFRRRGPFVIFVSRFLPGTRLPTYFAAGALRTSFWRFAGWFLLAVLAWTPLLVGLAIWLGERSMTYVEIFQRNAWWALLLLVLWILVVVKLLVPLFTHRGRRELVGRWVRWTHWEFWPPWLFYPPVAAWIVALGLRHRSWLLFTAANPAIEAGGFIAESKSRILAGLAGAGDLVARTALIPRDAEPAARLEAVRAFLAREGLDYPVVLKPDAGQRGSGVAVVRDEAQARAYLDEARFDLLVQQYAPGDEFGVFYVRLPGEERGTIFSITEKRIPHVEGDGRRTVERLILDDPRAVAMAEHYRRKQAHQLFRVPAPGERIPLVELGTHCRGAIFLDGRAFITPELERSIDRISRGFEGFYFGRYDVRTTDREAFRRGEGFVVIELNGVTSEATHIYDPRYGPLDAWRVLFRQWALAFEIGRRNRERGTRPVGWCELVRLIGEYRASSRSHPG